MNKEEPKEKIEEKETSDDVETVEVVEPISEEEVLKNVRKPEPSELDKWSPKTSLGKIVKNKEITDIDQILDSGLKILEKEIVELLLPNLENDLLLIGQSKGKFGGGQRRIFKQTQKKTREGNKPRFTTMAVVGNKDGYIGLGTGKSKETVPSREKAIRKAKLNIIKIRRGCGSWECLCKNPHSIPYSVEGKEGSVIIKLIPAPKGTGLVIESECAKLLDLVGIKDIWARSFGHTKTKMNVIKACFKALKKLGETKIGHQDIEKLGIIEGKSTPKSETDDDFIEEIKNGESKEPTKEKK
ncbi:MAG: 30S ribosomal protein S5 [Candidatus Woesearchaeota archaeon]